MKKLLNVLYLEKLDISFLLVGFAVCSGIHGDVPGGRALDRETTVRPLSELDPLIVRQIWLENCDSYVQCMGDF